MELALCELADDDSGGGSEMFPIPRPQREIGDHLQSITTLQRGQNALMCCRDAVPGKRKENRDDPNAFREGVSGEGHPGDVVRGGVGRAIVIGATTTA